MERAEGLLGGKFLLKRQNDRTIDKTKVVCSICQAECSYHRSSSCLSYHLNAKHPTESSPRLDGRQPTILCWSYLNNSLRFVWKKKEDKIKKIAIGILGEKNCN